MAADAPDIVLIMSDQHNAGAMGCAGNLIVRTPHLDALSRRGIRFTNAYCPYPLCAPSRAGFMAGTYPSEFGVYDNSGNWPTETPTFAHALGAGGVEAVLCGRMHFGPNDLFHGFERRIHGDVGACVSREILGTGPNRTNGQSRYAVEVAGHGRTGFQAFDRSVTQKACDVITGRRPGGRPLCLVVGWILPHNPLVSEQSRFDHYLANIAPLEPESPDTLAGLHPAIRAWRERRGVDALTPEQNRRALAAYYALVEEMDENLGRIVEAVAGSSRARQTLIVYTSDHGDMAGEQGMWWKSSFYDGSAKVPIIAAWPGRVPEGDVCESLVSLIDIGPTLLDLCGAPPLSDISGRSFAPLLLGRQVPDWPDEIFCEYAGLLGDRPSCMVRSSRWKLNYYSEFDSCQLFDLGADPGESRDLAPDPRHAETVSRLRSRILARWSPERVACESGKQKRAIAMVRSCGHPLRPHEVIRFEAGDEENAFDFSQLPVPPRGMPG